jgi:type IV pilus assembly protein PilW
MKAMLQRPPFRHQRGLTLVELMVALALGLVTTLIVAQVLINAEGQNRRTTSGTDAQINGASALYLLSQNIQSAGYGLIGHSGERGCPITWAGAPNASASGTLRLTPFEIITPAAEAAKAVGDRNIIIRTLSSGATDFSAPRKLRVTALNASDGFAVSSTLGLQANTIMMVSRRDWSGNGAWCLMFTAGAVNDTTRQVTPNAATLGANPASLTPPGGFRDDMTSLANLGAWPDIREYRLNTATSVLEMRRFDRATLNWVTEELARGIVRMVAYYGMDDNNDGRVDRYTQESPDDGAEGWRRVVTVRLAIVARSERVERPERVGGQARYATSGPLNWVVGATGAANAIEGAGPCAESTNEEDGSVVSSAQQCVSIGLGPDPAPDNGGVLAADPADWRNYRYKLFDTVIPLRNLVWSPT